MTRNMYVAVCERQGLDAAAIEAAAQSDVLSGALRLPQEAKITLDEGGQPVIPAAYWSWLISLVSV